MLQAKKRRPSTNIEWCSSLGLKAAPGPLVALASFPGSGNTWLRYLLQQATGTFMVLASFPGSGNTWLRYLLVLQQATGTYIAIPGSGTTCSSRQQVPT